MRSEDFPDKFGAGIIFCVPSSDLQELSEIWSSFESKKSFYREFPELRMISDDLADAY